MDTKLTLNYRLLIISLPLALIGFIVILINTKYYQIHTTSLAVPITLDLVLTLPVLYFLLIRKKAIPKITVASVFVLSIIAASYIIPIADQSLLSQIKTYAIPAIEIVVLSYVFMKMRAVYREFKFDASAKPDFFDVLYDATRKVLPTPLNGLMATEIAVVYYAIVNWRKKESYAYNEYTYHTKNGIFSVLYAFMGLACVELMAMHMLIAKYSLFWAWIATALTLYSLLQIFALIKSMSRRPIILDHKKGILKLRYGFFSQVDIELNQIREIELTRKSIAEDDKQTIPLSPLGLLDSHNIVLHLDKEYILTGFYGIKKSFTNIAIYADDREKLNQDLSEYIG